MPFLKVSLLQNDVDVLFQEVLKMYTLSHPNPSSLPTSFLPPSLRPFLPYQAEAEDDVLTKKRSNHLQRKLANRKAQAKVDPHVEDQFLTGRLYGGYQFLCNSCCTITRDSRIRCMIGFPKPSFFFFLFIYFF